MNLEKFGIDVKGRTSGQFKTTCPKCSHDRKKSKEPCLSVNIDEGVWNCHNCGWHGSLSQTMEKKKDYTPIDYNNTELPDDIVEWFSKRGISKATIQRFDIGWDGRSIQFPFYLDGDVVNIKSRSLDKRFSLVSGGLTVPFNMPSIQGASKIIITEGEIDALSAYEAQPSTPVISIPNGTKSLDWLDMFWDRIRDVDSIILATDGDAPGIECRDKLATRLGKHRCSYVSYPEGCKDLNEAHVKYGVSSVRMCLSNPVDFPVDGLVEFKDYKDEVLKFHQDGYPSGERVGPASFKDLIAFQPGQVTVITGTPGSGKSEFTDQIMVWLNQYCKWKFGVISFENQPVSFHVTKLCSKLTEKPLMSIDLEELGHTMDIISDNFFFYDLQTNDLTIDGIIEKGKELVGRYGINSLLIDPYNYIEHKIPNGMSETNYISEVLSKVVAFAKSYNAHVFFVAHPRKMPKKDDGSGNYVPPNLYDISGSAHWFNKADNGITVWRDFHSNRVEIFTTKVRFDWNGKVGSCDLYYDVDKKIYTEMEDFPFG